MRRLIGASLALTILAMSTAMAPPSASAKTGGGGCHEAKTDRTGTTVDLKHNCFLPTVLRVDEGTTVTFTSLDVQIHTVTSAGSQQDGGWGSFDELGEGSIVTETFEETGVFPYFCVFHPGMVGTIVVGDGGGGVNGEAPSNEGAGLPAGSADTSASIVAASIGGTMVVLVVLAVVGGLVVRRRGRNA